MQALRKLIAVLPPLLEKKDPSLLRQTYRRVVAPAGDALSHSGSLFALGQHGVITQIGEVQQQVAVLRWLRPAAGELASLYAEREVGEDIASLLTLATRRRVRTLPEITMQQEGTTATVFVPIADMADTELPSPVSSNDLATVEALLWSILAIKRPEEFDAIAQAIRLYHAAILVIPSAPTAGYTLLTAALETLSSQAEPPPAVWMDWSEASAWDALIQKAGLSGEQTESIRKRLLAAPHLNLQRRFLSYVTKMVPDSFWTEPWSIWAPGVTLDAGVASLMDGARTARETDERGRHGKTQLSDLLRRVYQARSGYVHEGETLSGAALLGFPEVQLSAEAAPPAHGADLPSLEFVERLVHAVLLEAVRVAEKDPSLKKPDLTISGE